MTTPNNRRAQPSLWGPDTILMYGTGALAISISLIMWISIQIGWKLAGLGHPEGGFWTIVFGTIRGTTTWPTASTIVAIATVLTIAIAITAGRLLIGHRTRHQTRVDQSSHYLGVRQDISPLSKASVVAKAKRLGVDPSTPGIPIGVTVATGERLYGSWEDMHVDIWGPRTGKTTSRAIPAILAAPGSVLVTSNKRDVVDATRDLRAERGPVWVFDPQHIAGEQPTRWWWNPLSYVTDEVQASKLAAHFASGSRPAGARTDAFFDPAGQDLLAGLLLAAAVDRRPITDVYRWLTRPTDDTPMRLVAAAGYELTADQLAGVIFAPDKQRGGVYGTAQQMASCLTNRQIAAWITPQAADDPRAQLRATDFVHADGGTLYSLSKEGASTAGPLVTALTAAVAEAAEELAARSAGGRLKTPLLGVLDEAANVCRWTDLPALYSHYGSRGIILMTILQSWSQGVDVWGESGMRKLWSAANVAIYGGGVKEREFLDTLAGMIGDYDKTTRSVSVGKGHRNITQQLNRQRILDPADLAAMPPGRAIVLASGARPTLIATQPWMTSPHAAAIRASIAAHDPSQDTQPQETPT